MGFRFLTTPAQWKKPGLHQRINTYKLLSLFNLIQVTMKLFTTLFSLTILAAMILTGCRKDDEIPPSDAKLIPTKIIFAYPTGNNDGARDGSTVLFHYDEYERLAEIVHTTQTGDDLRITRKTTLVYDEQGQLDREEIEENYPDEKGVFNPKSYTNTFTYEGNTVRVSGAKNAVYTLNDNGLLIKVEHFYENGGSSRITYEYDGKGNMTQSRYNDESIQYSYGYDRKNGIYRWVLVPQWYLIGASLPFNENRTNNLDATYRGKEKEFGYGYQYNEQDYPVSQRMIYHHPDIAVCFGPSEVSIEYKSSARFWCGTI